MVMFSRMVRWLKRLNCWNTIPIFWRSALRSTPAAQMSCPSKMTLPPLGSSRRLRHRKKVLLPLPEGPITTTTSPLLDLNVDPLEDLQLAEVLLETLGLDQNAVICHCV